MSKIVAQARNELRAAILDAMGRAVAEGTLPAEPTPDFSIETPANREHGDYAANVAMVSARAFKMAPRKIAEIIFSQLVLDGTLFDRCEIAGPGFLNFYLGKRFYAAVLEDIEALGPKNGRSD